MKEVNIRDVTSAMIVDISIRGLWQPQTAVLLDVQVVDTNAPVPGHSMSAHGVGLHGSQAKPAVQ